MRLRNVVGAYDVVLNSPYVIKDEKKYKGNFKSLFLNSNPIMLEIGMGKGDFIINMAKNNPDLNFIGIEKYDSVLVRAIQKIDNDIPNLKFIRMDATYIDLVFEKEIDTIYLNFSDPWPKARHENRRLTSLNFLKKYDNLFCNDKKIIMKTDNRKLFEFSIVSLSTYGYIVKNVSLDLHKDDIKNNIETEYEKKFSSIGNPIYKLEVVK